MEAKATILGIPDQPTVTEVNCHKKPTTDSPIEFTAPIGFGNLPISRVKQDKREATTDGKIHYWIKIVFPGGADGWVRDDQIAIEGDCAKFGYADGLPQTRASELDIDPTAPKPGPDEEPATGETAPAIPSAPATNTAPPAPTAPAGQQTTATAPAPATSSTKKFEATGKVRIRDGASLSAQHLGWVEATTIVECEEESQTEADGYIWWKHADGWSAEKSSNGQQVFLQPALVIGGPVVPISSREGFDDLNRIKLASYAVTGNFEGSGYAAYNNYDAGIISYGLIQFTMAAGSMITVVQRYLQNSQTDVANQLREYLPRIEARDQNLRNDEKLKNLLIAAADEQVMKDAQHSVADEKYWDKVWKGYIEPRGLQTPLGIALLFDMGVNFGTGHGWVRLAEEQLGVPPQSKPGQNGITEEQLIQRVAELRKGSHDKQAREQGFYGLKKRGDFWVRLVNNGDWGLLGDANGNVNVNGKIVQVRNP